MERNRQWSSVRFNRLSARNATSLGLSVRDSCSSTVLTAVHSEELSHDSYRHASAHYSVRGVTSPLSHKYSDQACNPKLLMMIGPSSNEETAAISPLLSSRRINHISLLASSNAFRKQTNYPYLFKAVPAIYFQVDAIADIIEAFGWKYVSLISSDGVFGGEEGADYLRGAVRRRGHSFCLAMDETFSTKYRTNALQGIMRRLDQDKRAKIIVLFAGKNETVQFLTAMVDAKISNRVLLTGETWVNEVNVKLLPPNLTVLGLSPRPINLERFRGFRRSLENMFKSPQAVRKELNENPFFRPFLEDQLKCDLGAFCGDKYLCRSLSRKQQSFRRKCNEEDLVIKNIPKLEHMGTFVFAAEVAIRAAFAVHRKMLSRSECLHPDRIFAAMFCELNSLRMPCNEKYFMKRRWPDGADRGRCRAFTRSKSSSPVYTVYNVQRSLQNKPPQIVPVAVWSDFTGRTPDARLNWLDRIDWGNGHLVDWNDSTKWPISTCSSACRFGQKRHYDDLFLAHCCWSCQDCDIMEYTASADSETCLRCPAGFEPNLERSNCTKFVPVIIDRESSVVAVCLFICSASSLGAVLTLVIFWKRRSTPLIRASNLRLSIVILAAMAFGCSATMLSFLRPNETLCKSILAATYPLVCLAVSGILVKTHHFAELCQHLKASGGKCIQRIPLIQLQIGFMFLASFVDFLMLIIGIGAQTMTVKHVRYPAEGRTAILVCEWSTGWKGVVFSYHVLLNITCLWFGFRSRNAPLPFNEARLTFLASVCTLFAWMGVIPASYITSDSLRPIVFSMSVTTIFFAAWASLFATRLYGLYYSKKNVPDSPEIDSRRSTVHDHVPDSSG